MLGVPPSIVLADKTPPGLDHSHFVQGAGFAEKLEGHLALPASCKVLQSPLAAESVSRLWCPAMWR